MIDTSWRSQSQADSTPRFVETLTSSSQAWSQSHGVQSVDVEGFLRATQGGAREFEQTQTQAVGAAVAAASQAYVAASSSQGGSQFVGSQGFGPQVRKKTHAVVFVVITYVIWKQSSLYNSFLMWYGSSEYLLPSSM